LALDGSEERYRPRPRSDFDEIHGDHSVRYIFASKFVNRGVVLDSGCGYGYGSLFLAHSGADYVVGIDNDMKCITAAKNWFTAPNLDFIIADSNRLPLRNNAFDVVASLEVIEHVDDCERYLEETKRVLVAGGNLILSTPNKLHTDRTGLMPLFHIREFYPGTLSLLLGEYFSVLGLYGKNIARSAALPKSTLHARARLAAARVSGISLLRLFLRRMPLQILHMLRFYLDTGYVPPLRPEDFEISQGNISTASNLIAVCTKASG
jgi:2-polyprenyl-3-methyl-5-hydroxy-6-metoxy-1,4-benzoquinol methylase